jgi:uncharacterized membrane protein YgcG
LKLRPNKKGVLFGSLLGVIISVIVVVIILGVTALLLVKGSDTISKESCRGSVVVRAKAVLNLFNVVKMEQITPLACETHNLGTIRGSREEIKREIADNAASCWWQFAEGEVPDVFKVEKIESGCFVCYTFTIKDNMDSGTPSLLAAFEEPQMRDENKISNAEMTNFLISESYNPGLIYGGGTKNYFGFESEYDEKYAFKGEAREIRASSIKAGLVSGFVMDFSYTLDEETKNKLNEIGSELQQKNISNMLIVVADTFKDMKREDARIIIENTNLNSIESAFDGIVVTMDLKNRKMRIHMGADLSVLIKEYDLAKIMEDKFAAIETECKDDVRCFTNKVLIAVVTKMKEEMTSTNELLTISPKSYYYYLSNGGYTWTMISDIEPERTYAITYVSASDETGLGLSKLQGGLAGAGVGAGVIVVAASVVSGGIAIPVLATISAAAAGFYGGAGSSGGIMQRPNNIMIVPVNALSSRCTMVK